MAEPGGDARRRPPPAPSPSRGCRRATASPRSGRAPASARRRCRARGGRAARRSRARRRAMRPGPALSSQPASPSCVGSRFRTAPSASNSPRISRAPRAPSPGQRSRKERAGASGTRIGLKPEMIRRVFRSMSRIRSGAPPSRPYHGVRSIRRARADRRMRSERHPGRNPGGGGAGGNDRTACGMSRLSSVATSLPARHSRAPERTNGRRGDCGRPSSAPPRRRPRCAPASAAGAPPPGAVPPRPAFPRRSRGSRSSDWARRRPRPRARALRTGACASTGAGRGGSSVRRRALPSPRRCGRRALLGFRRRPAGPRGAAHREEIEHDLRPALIHGRVHRGQAEHVARLGVGAARHRVARRGQVAAVDGVEQRRVGRQALGRVARNGLRRPPALEARQGRRRRARSPGSRCCAARNCA